MFGLLIFQTISSRFGTFKSGPSCGAIVGIVVGVIMGLVLFAFVGFLGIGKLRARGPEQPEPGTAQEGGSTAAQDNGKQMKPMDIPSGRTNDIVSTSSDRLEVQEQKTNESG